MSSDKAGIIDTVCDAIAREDEKAAAAALREYPFVALHNAGRSYGPVEATRVFMRDGFIDRYSGARLVHPAVLRILSKLFPRDFPFQKNWKMTETHIAYWELCPTLDHMVPIARGGADSEENWVTTSMVRNAAKANWTLEELAWQVSPPGTLSEWDGLTGWLMRYVEEHGVGAQENYVVQWYKAACKVASSFSLRCPTS
ncbi:HNH endonuclease [Candidatus Methylocalor cossyra]|uniref:HNH endonuclease n=1 Tax=Candidatus Methylocalor cossyra TaxID=3108543 RepID=A0ABM9NMQ8_9GAMM